MAFKFEKMSVNQGSDDGILASAGQVCAYIVENTVRGIFSLHHMKFEKTKCIHNRHIQLNNIDIY